MLTQDQIETMREIAGKASESPGYERVRLLPVWVWTSAWNGKAWVPVLTEAGREVLALCPVAPKAPSDDADLADALAYAAEIEADPTPPTSSTHRWLVVLAKALRAAEDGPDALWFVVHNRDGKMVVEPFRGAGARHAARMVARGRAAGWSEVYVMRAHAVRSDDADGDVPAPDLKDGAAVGAFLDAICKRLGMPDAHLVRFPTNVPDGRGGTEPALWWALADGLGKPIRVETDGRHYWAGATKWDALMAAWGEIP